MITNQTVPVQPNPHHTAYYGDTSNKLGKGGEKKLKKKYEQLGYEVYKLNSNINDKHTLEDILKTYRFTFWNKRRLKLLIRYLIGRTPIPDLVIFNRLEIFFVESKNVSVPLYQLVNSWHGNVKYQKDGFKKIKRLGFTVFFENPRNGEKVYVTD